MLERRSRGAAGEGMTFGRRLRLLRRRAARWFQPPVRSAADSVAAGPDEEPSPVSDRGSKRPLPLH